MAWTNLFTIGSTDLTQWEVTTAHAVNRDDVFEEWTDGNLITHRVISRTRVSGTVQLSFSRLSDYTSFLSLLTSEKNANGYYAITVYCSNTGTSESINAFLDVSGATRWDVTSPIKHNTVTVAIMQR